MYGTNLDSGCMAYLDMHLIIEVVTMSKGDMFAKKHFQYSTVLFPPVVTPMGSARITSRLHHCSYHFNNTALRNKK